MDKEEMYKPLEMLSAFQFKNFLSDHQWSEQVAFCSDESISQRSSQKNEEKKHQTKNETNIMKHFGNLIDSSYLEEKFKKENEETKTEIASKFISNIKSNMDDYYERKISLYEKVLSRYSENKTKSNQLKFIHSPLLEKNALSPMLIMESFPGLKPSSNWPLCLDELVDKLEHVKIDELFLQPFDESMKTTFVDEALEAIERFDKENEIENLQKGVAVLITMLILFGDIILLLKTTTQLQNLTHKKDLDDIFTNQTKYSLVLNDKIKQLYYFACENNFTPYPIMRNYSIVDFYNITKTILYDQSFTKSSSICTDGTYIYAIINGLDGCKLKIGSGYNGTERGKVYLSSPLSSDAIYQWVYCKGKIYMKAQHPSSNSSYTNFGYGYTRATATDKEKELGYLHVISPEDLNEEGNVKLLLPQRANHYSVIKKNERYILLSDGESISVLILEPVSESEHLQKKRNERSNEDDEEIVPDIELVQELENFSISKQDKTFNYVNLELITYKTSDEMNEKKDENQKKLIDELYESFSHLYSKVECYKALVRHNWNMEKTAMYLVESPADIKESLLIGEEPIVLFQTKIEAVSSQNKTTKIDLKPIKNPFFNLTHFDTLKWSITKEYVIAHKFKEGACAIFGRGYSHYKEYEYIFNQTSKDNNIEILYQNYIASQNKHEIQIKVKKEEKKEKKEKTVLSDKIIGTLIKTTNSLMYSNEDYIVTYDNIHNVYFLMNKGTYTSLSIMISDTFISSSQELGKIFSLDFTSISEFFTKLFSSQTVVNFSEFISQLINLSFVLSTCKKCDSFWRYKNWNYYYNSLLDYANLKSQNWDDGVFGKEYTQSILTSKNVEISKKSLCNRIEKLAKKNKEDFIAQLPKEISELTMKEIVSIDTDIENRKYMNHAVPSPDSNNWGNWMSKVGLLFKEKKKKNKLGEMITSMKGKNIYIDNKIYFYFGIDGEIASLEYIINLFDSNEKLAIKLLYLWIKNSNDTLFLSHCDKIKHLLDLINKKLLSLWESPSKETVLLLLLEGWEILNRDISSQLKWFKLFFSYETSFNKDLVPLSPNIEENILFHHSKFPFSILMMKSDLTRSSLYLLNNFNKVNNVKRYTFYPVERKGKLKLLGAPHFNSLTVKNIQTPLHWALYGYSLSDVKFPIKEQNDVSLKEEKEENYSMRKNISFDKKTIAYNALMSRIPYTKKIEIYVNEEYDIKANEDLWTFFVDNCKNEKIVDYCNDLFAMSIGDMNQIYKDKIEKFCFSFWASSKSPKDETNNEIVKIFSNTESDYYSKYLTFLLKSSSFISKIISSSQSLSAILLYRNFLYSLFSKIKNSSISILHQLNEIFNDALRTLHRIKNSNVAIVNDLGNQFESAISFDYTISSGEALCIDKTLSLDTDVIAVEIDFKQSKLGAASVDLLIVSEDHPYANLGTYSTNNQFNQFGTSFQMKLNAPTSTVVYLKGKQIKIVSPPEIELNRANQNKKMLPLKSNYLKTLNNGKSYLKIKCYPYNNQFFIADTKEDNLNVLCDVVLLINDVEFFSALIYKNLIKSFDVDIANADLLRKHSIMRLGFKNYSHANELFDIYRSKMFYNVNNYNLCGIFSDVDNIVNDVDIDNDYAYLSIILRKIREKTKEPIVYSNIKKLPSFTAKDKWSKVELLSLLCILYHLNILNDFKAAIEKDNFVVIEPYFEQLGMKINSIVGQMASKAKTLKDWYDAVKVNCDEYVEEYEKECEMIKEMIISNELKGKSVVKEEKKKDKKKRLERKFLSKKDPEYKKKKNKRYYSETPSHSNTQQSETQIEEVDYHSMSLSEIISLIENRGTISKETSAKIESLGKLIEKYLSKIEKESREQFFGDSEKLKSICELTKIEYNESNPLDSIAQYAKSIYNTMVSLINANKFSFSINKSKLSSSLCSLSPFLTVALSMSKKLFFLLSLNNFDVSDSNGDLPLLERLLSITRENSRTHSLHSSMRSKSKKNDDEDNYLFDKTQNILLRSIMNFILKPTDDINHFAAVLNQQFIRAKVRANGISMLSQAIANDFKTDALNGLLSSAVKNDVYVGIESAKVNCKESEIVNLLCYYMNHFIRRANEVKEESDSEMISTMRRSKKKMTKGEINFINAKNILEAISDINIMMKMMIKHRSKNEIEIDYAVINNFIDAGIELLFMTMNCDDGVVAKIKNLSDEIVIIVLSKIIKLLSTQKNIAEIIFSKFSAKLDLFIAAKNEAMIAKILEFLQNLLNTAIESKSTSKITSKLIELIETSDKYEIVSMSVGIITHILKGISPKSIDPNRLFAKIGKIFLFNKNSLTAPQISDEKFYVVVQMNSIEIDYQFLVNALYLWEEKYPTQLSEYKDKEFAKVSAVKVEEVGAHKVKMFSYFNTQKAKTNKMTLMNKIVDERITNNKKALDEANKSLKDKKNESKIDDIKSRITILQRNDKYLTRIKSHIKLATEIGEIASIRGFAVLSPSLSLPLAKELAELIHKANNKLLPHIPISPDEPSTYLFNDDIIYPKMPDQAQLEPGCTNTLKETTKDYINVALVRSTAYEKLVENWKFFAETAKKNGAYEEKKKILGTYNKNYLFGYLKSTIMMTNYNDGQSVIDCDVKSGASMSMIIECVVDMLYESAKTNMAGIVKMIRVKLQKLKNEWQNENKKIEIIGMLIFIADFYKSIRKNSKAIFNKTLCKVVSGGDKKGQSHCDVIIESKDGDSSGIKIEKILLKNLCKYEHNAILIKNIALKEIIDNILFAYDEYANNKESLCNKYLLHLLLKILNVKKIDTNELLNYIKKDNDAIAKFHSILTKISSSTIWLEKEDHFWEAEFIDSFERIYDKIDLHSHIIFSPVFDFSPSVAIAPNVKLVKDTDIISKFNLPETNYVKQLPKLTDLSKVNTALKNIQIFDRFIVGEIFAYCKKQYSAADYFNSLTQIRNHLSNGDIENTMIDLRSIFDNNSMPTHIPLPKEHYDSKEIMKEEIYPGNFYLAKLSSKFINSCAIKCIKKLNCIGVNEVPVLVLLQDNAINHSLVMINDEECGKIFSFWVNSDNLMFLEKQIKLPASAFEMEALVGEYKYLEKRLKVLYAKNTLSNFMFVLAQKQQISSFNNLIDYIILNNWKGYKLNPTSGVYHRFNNFITVKRSETIEKVLKTKHLLKAKHESHTFEDILNNLAQGNSLDDEQRSSNNEMNLNKIISNLNIDGQSALSLVIKWCMTNWSQLPSQFQIISTNLFTEYTRNTSANAKTVSLPSKEMFHVGNFSNKLLALHELFGESASVQHCGIILTFDKTANLGPHAKLTFYSDPYGENAIHEIDSFKTLTSNLESCVFNYPKVWMNYTPGTRAFYTFEWDLQTRDSNLPCTIAFVPYNWSPLVQLTDYCTSALFNNVNGDEMEIYRNILKVLIDNCITMNIPAEIQRRIFTITNRAILKCSKFISLLSTESNFSKMKLKEKFAYLGIEEKNVISLINKIGTFSEQNTDKSFSSAYVVEGVEIILSILSVIGESYNALESYLKDNFNYNLPIWIEAIIKLGQLLNYMQGTSSLDESMKREIIEQNNIDSSMFNNVIIVKYEKKEGSSVDIETVKDIIKEYCGYIVDSNKDIIVREDYVGILVDGFILDGRLSKEEEERKKKEEEEKRKKEEAEELWTCFYCKNENAQENEECLFCFKLKKVLPKEKPKKVENKRKMSLVDEKSITSALSDKMNSLLRKLKTYMEGVSSNVNILQGDKIIKESNRTILNAFLSERLSAYITEGDFINEKLRMIKSNKETPHEIISLLDTIKDNKDPYTLHLTLLTHKIDFWFESTTLDISKLNLNISLMEKIREEIDNKISKSGKYSATLPSTFLRVIPLNFSTINHTNLLSLKDIPLPTLRYYWTIIKYFNNCLVEALPFIKPPDYYMTSSPSLTEEGYINIPFPRTISAFLSSARGIMFSFIKNGLVKEVLSTTEYTEEEVQIPTFKFERLSIASSVEKKNAIINKLNSNDDDNGNANNDNHVEYKIEDSMFLQAYEQSKAVDVAFFRSKKMPGDPHVGFKVEFKNELVQGLGGPYRQFFSDISTELTSFLPLLIPTSNNIADKGEFKDRFTLSSSYNSSTALNHFEFLGVLMGICIRTGVHLTLDLASIIWKKIIDEPIGIEDVYQYDEGLYNMITAITDKDLTVDAFNNNFNYTFTCELTDRTIKELLPDGNNLKVNFTERIKYANLLVSARLSECDMQIDSIRKGLSKIIPISLLKLLTYKELEQLVCGAKTVDIALLKQNTCLSPDLTEKSNKVRWLWEILNEMSDEDKVKFVKFCWAQERLPATNEEFQKNQIRFTIKSHTDKNKKNIFPRADTCFFNLELPEYTSKEIMKNKIIQAINLDNVGMNADKVSRDVLNGNNMNNFWFNNRNQDEDDEEFEGDSMWK